MTSSPNHVPSGRGIPFRSESIAGTCFQGEESRMKTYTTTNKVFRRIILVASSLLAGAVVALALLWLVGGAPARMVLAQAGTGVIRVATGGSDAPGCGSAATPCRKTYDEYPDSTLHVSSEEYLGYLTLAQRKGEIIFTVDYALEPDNVAFVYEASRALGFVPFVSNRALDRYVAPVP